MWVTVAVGLLASLALLAVGLQIDAGRDRLRDDAARVAAANALRAQFDSLDGQVRDISGLYEASRRVESPEFQEFVRPMLRRSRASALAFLRLLDDGERARFEREERMPVRELGPDGTQRTAGRRDRYLVVTRAVFDSVGMDIDGLDVLPLPDRRRTLGRVETTGGVAASASIMLAYNGDHGLVLFAPVHRDGKLLGVISGAFSHRVLVGAVRRALDDDVALRVSTAGGDMGASGTVPETAARTPVSYGGQRFDVAVAVPNPNGLRFGPLGLGLGALLTALAMILQSTLRTRRRLAIGEARFADAFEASPVGQGLALHDGRFDRINPALCAITGHAADDLVSRTAVDLVHPADRERAELLLGRALATPGVAAGAEVRLLTADLDRAQATAERLVEAVEHGVEHGVTASVGVAMLDGSLMTADDALMAADLAMYDAKHEGRRRTAFYEGGAKSSTHSRLQWVDRIRTALAEERFALLAQPIVDLDSGRTHHEILLRMLDADGELIAPGSFLPIAEQFGLMGEIDRWVATRAIAAIAANPDRDLVFEVNLSGSSLGSPELLEAIRSAMISVGPGRVIFEITETAAVTNFEAAHAFATELAGLGCRFALDDFGVGFGSFSYVKHLPFDFLKIDGEFVRHSATSEEDRVILESQIHAARGLGKRTIAEYVEDAETVTLLRELGVDMVQGFYIGVPRPLDEVLSASSPV